MSRIYYADDEAAHLRAQGKDSKTVGQAIHEMVTRDHPIYLGIVNEVIYREKSGCYVIQFHGDASSARVTNDVAQFLLTHAFSSILPTVQAHMSDGVIDSVTLLFVTREEGK